MRSGDITRVAGVTGVDLVLHHNTYAAAKIYFGASGICLWNSAICLLAPAASFAGIQRSSAAP